ncbi:MAG: hypothetical protein QNI89_02525 [Desulfobacterales bacterium]|nr:hypothetical protein [Desulfobacterales bacterium]MDJ0856733.1 hypothetical protein [Desulfobacterales bacterium]MDJ0886143.1 hypothetical protein [Desulfobacterales bacterium]
MSLDLRQMRFYSGGHQGAEAAFGEQAEAYGIREINFAYPGQAVFRRRGLTMLGPEALKKGAISMEIVSLRMGRTFSRESEIRKVLQTIFHMVNMGHQVFSVGWIQPDGTVKGGTGWAVELGKWFNRPVSVFDLDKNGWFAWREGQWQADMPVIRYATFVGTGTRNLNPEGRWAIKDLFAKNFKKRGRLSHNTT